MLYHTGTQPAQYSSIYDGPSVVFYASLTVEENSLFSLCILHVLLFDLCGWMTGYSGVGGWSILLGARDDRLLQYEWMSGWV